LLKRKRSLNLNKLGFGYVWKTRQDPRLRPWWSRRGDRRGDSDPLGRPQQVFCDGGSDAHLRKRPLVRDGFADLKRRSKQAELGVVCKLALPVLEGAAKDLVDLGLREELLASRADERMGNIDDLDALSGNVDDLIDLGSCERVVSSSAAAAHVAASAASAREGPWLNGR
jgi:hypothetical protein